MTIRDCNWLSPGDLLWWEDSNGNLRRGRYVGACEDGERVELHYVADGRTYSAMPHASRVVRAPTGVGVKEAVDDPA